VATAQRTHVCRALANARSLLRSMFLMLARFFFA